MAHYRKLGRTASQRKAMLRSLTTSLLLHGKIETTETRAKEVRKIAEKYIALAVKEKDNFETKSMGCRGLSLGNTLDYLSLDRKVESRSQVRERCQSASRDLEIWDRHLPQQ